VDAGNNLLHVTSTHPNTIVNVSTGDGTDHVRVVRPSSRVNVNGGVDRAAGDRVTVVGNAGDDAFRVRGETITLGSAVVATTDVERRIINGVSGDDQIAAVGVVGTDEAFRITPRNVANSANLTTGVFSNVVFVNVPNIRVSGNTPDNDRLVFVGTNGSDQSNVNMAARGNVADPYLQFTSTSGAALTLFGYGGVGTPRLLGRDGVDTFDVYVADAGPASGRQVNINGGSPAFGRQADRLRLHYRRAETTAKHVPTDADTGTIDALFSNRRFGIFYDEIEDVVLLPF